MNALDVSIRFVDVEASGLHEGSYPIEVAWADVTLRAEGFLIRPMGHWGVRDWNPESERIHNISRSLLLEQGISALEAAERINGALDGKIVLSDAPSFDGGWLRRLFVETGVKPLFRIDDFGSQLATLAERPDFPSLVQLEKLIEQVSERYPHTHRAGDDAMQMAALWRCLSDAGWRDSNGFEG